MSDPPIYFHKESVTFRLSDKARLSNWISKVIKKENGSIGPISFVYCNDEYLREKNCKYLKNNELTDIVAFDYCEGNKISGDIFISVDRIRINAVSYKTGFNNELHRVMVHGVLHLLGYKDKNAADRAVMIEKEDLYLSLLPSKS